MPTQYTSDELRDASNKVMKSLNNINQKATRSLARPAIRNSTGLAEGRISKSAKKRRNRKARNNLAGKPMDDLLEVLPPAPEPEKIPDTLAEIEQQQVSQANQKAHHSRKAENKLINHEIANFKIKSLEEIKQRIRSMNAANTKTID